MKRAWVKYCTAACAGWWFMSCCSAAWSSYSCGCQPRSCRWKIEACLSPPYSYRAARPSSRPWKWCRRLRTTSILRRRITWSPSSPPSALALVVTGRTWRVCLCAWKTGTSATAIAAPPLPSLNVQLKRSTKSRKRAFSPAARPLSVAWAAQPDLIWSFRITRVPGMTRWWQLAINCSSWPGKIRSLPAFVITVWMTALSYRWISTSVKCRRWASPSTTLTTPCKRHGAQATWMTLWIAVEWKRSTFSLLPNTACCRTISTAGMCAITPAAWCRSRRLRRHAGRPVRRVWSVTTAIRRWRLSVKPRLASVPVLQWTLWKNWFSSYRPALAWSGRRCPTRNGFPARRRLPCMPFRCWWCSSAWRRCMKAGQCRSR